MVEQVDWRMAAAARPLAPQEMADLVETARRMTVAVAVAALAILLRGALARPQGLAAQVVHPVVVRLAEPRAIQEGRDRTAQRARAGVVVAAALG